MYSQLKIFLIFFVFILFCDPLSSGAKMISVNREGVNIRSDPSTRSQVKWKVDKGFPLNVIGSRGKWYKVRDFENDEGWVYSPLTIHKAHLVVKKPVKNIRSGPGPNYRIVTQAKHGVVFQTLTKVKGWVKVRHESGVTGWVARRLLWGW